MHRTPYGPTKWSKAPDELVERLKNYQRVKGLKVDGEPGVQTVDQLLLDYEYPPAPVPDCPPPKPPSRRLNGLVWIVMLFIVVASGLGYLTSH